MSTSSLYWSTSERNCKLSHFRTSVILQNTWFRLVFKLSLELTLTCYNHIVSITTRLWPTVWETSCFIQDEPLEQVNWWFISFRPFYATATAATAITVTITIATTTTATATREFKKLRRLLQRKRHIKIELCVRLSVLLLFQVGHVVQNRPTTLSLAWHE